MGKRDKFKKNKDAKGQESAFEKFERKVLEANRGTQDTDDKNAGEEEYTLQGALGFLSLSLAKHKEETVSILPEKDDKRKTTQTPGRRKSLWNKRQSVKKPAPWGTFTELEKSLVR